MLKATEGLNLFPHLFSKDTTKEQVIMGLQAPVAENKIR